MKQKRSKSQEQSESEQSAQIADKEPQKNIKVANQDDDDLQHFTNKLPQKGFVDNQNTFTKKQSNIQPQNILRPSRSRKPSEKKTLFSQSQEEIRRICNTNTDEKIKQLKIKYVDSIKFESYQSQKSDREKISHTQRVESLYGNKINWTQQPLHTLKTKIVSVCYVKFRKIIQNKSQDQIKNISICLDKKEKQIRLEILQVVLQSINKVKDRHQSVRQETFNFIIWHFLKHLQLFLSNESQKYQDGTKEQQSFIMFSVLAKQQFTAYVKFLQINLPACIEEYLIQMFKKIQQKISKQYPNRKKQLQQDQLFSILEMFQKFQPEAYYFIVFGTSYSFIYSNEQWQQSIQQVQNFVKNSQFLHHLYVQFFNRFSKQVSKKIKPDQLLNYDFTNMKSAQTIKAEMKNVTILYLDNLHKWLHGLTSPNQVNVSQNEEQKKQYVIYVSTILFNNFFRRSKQILQSHVVMTITHQISHFLVRKLGYYKKNEVKRSLPQIVSKQCKNQYKCKKKEQFDTGHFLQCFLFGYKIEGITGKQFQKLQLQCKNYKPENDHQNKSEQKIPNQNNFKFTLQKIKQQFLKNKHQFKKQYKTDKQSVISYNQLLSKSGSISDQYLISYRQKVCFLDGVIRYRKIEASEEQEQEESESDSSIIKK